MTTDPLAALRALVAHELRDTSDWADYIDITVPLHRMRAIRDAIPSRAAGVRVSEDAGLRMFPEVDAPRSLVNLADEWVAKAEATGIAALNVRAFAVWAVLQSGATAHPSPAAVPSVAPQFDGGWRNEPESASPCDWPGCTETDVREWSRLTCEDHYIRADEQWYGAPAPQSLRDAGRTVRDVDEWSRQNGDPLFSDETIAALDAPALTVERLAEALHAETCMQIGFGDGYFDADHMGSSTCTDRAAAILRALGEGVDRG